MKLRCCLLVLLAMSVTGCGKGSAYSSTEGWIRFKSPDGPYSVLMPSKPVRMEQTLGDEAMVMHTSEIDPDQGVMTWCMDLPPKFEVGKKKVVDDFFDQTLQAVATNFNGTIADKKNLIIDKLYPCRDATIKVKDGNRTMVLRTRFVLTPDKLIQVIVIAKEAESTEPAVKKCLDSIKIDHLAD